MIAYYKKKSAQYIPSNNKKDKKEKLKQDINISKYTISSLKYPQISKQFVLTNFLKSIINKL